MRAGISFLLVALCAVGGFQAVRRSGAGHASKSGSRVGDGGGAEQKPESVNLEAGVGGKPFDWGAIEAAAPGGKPEWTQAPKTLLELMRWLGADAMGPAGSRLAVMEAIGRMSPAELGELLSNEAENPDFFRRTAFDFQFAARRLAEVAPEQAAQLWLSKASLRMQSEELLGPWARRDPQAFAAWCLKLSPDSQKATAAALGGIAKENPEQFVVVASQLGGSVAAATAARTAMEAFLDAPRDKGGVAAAREFAGRLPEGPMRTTALAQLAKMPGIDLAAYPEVLEAVAALPREDARRLGRDMAQSAEVLPPSPARESAFVSAFRDQAERDLGGAVKRLESMGGSADYPAAVRGFVDATARKDPASALQWALAIPQSDPGSAGQVQRSAALERAVSELFKQDPEAARQWVQTAPLTPQEYFQLTGRKRQP